MARYFTLLTLALVTATQTAQAFPTEELYGGYNVQIERVSIGKMDVSLVRSYLLILEVAAEKDPALADAFESVLEMHLDDDATLEVMLVLIAMKEDFRLGDVSGRTIAIFEPRLNSYTWKVEEAEALDLGRFGSSFMADNNSTLRLKIANYDTPPQRKRR